MSTAKQDVLLDIGRQSLPDRLIELAVASQNIDADKLAKLMELKLTWESNEARKAYIEAMQQFKNRAPEIMRTKHVQYATSSGMVDYWHAELDKVTTELTEALLAVGIHHSWRMSDQAGKITATCVLTHKDGHSEDAATLSGPPDTSGGKNSIQAVGSTTSYLQRYTLLAACGVAVKGQDDDGKTEGLAGTVIEEYCEAMKDTTSMDDLRRRFDEAWKAAKIANDATAQKRFMAVKEARKKDLREFGQ